MKGVNYILGGDTHERVRKPIECKYAKVVEPGAFGSFIGKLDLTVENGKVTGDTYELLEVTADKIKPDPVVAKIVAENEQPYQDEINKVIGYSTIPLYRYFVVENPIDTLVLNGLKWKFKDVDIVLSNGFRFAHPMPPLTIPGTSRLRKATCMICFRLTASYAQGKLPVHSYKNGLKKSSTMFLLKRLRSVLAAG
ncbi:bifunctional UDP-sugar hydrolase/5'-nucleotidase [Flavobacterium rhizosphaerae]|uniref:Uncharacterized protein n=1 Tax=Flavobacterium rhizosphaerae TaxID=3163298 RepID=A0ABW8YVI1_9FLAO